MSTPRFTILTPTFNRAHTLDRVFDSLIALESRDFEWLIIDDGSIDKTAALIREWKSTVDFPIRYFYQKNSHKKTALNTGFKLCSGDFTIILDSDDTLMPDALAIFSEAWDSIPEKDRHLFSGVRALCIDASGAIVGDIFPTDPLDASANELLYRYRVKGEKLSCDRTEILRRFPFPEDVKGLVPEQVLWSQLSKDYRCRCVNRTVRKYFTSPDSLSAKLATADYLNDLEGLCFAYTFVLDQEYNWFFVNPSILIKAAGNRKRFIIHLRHIGNTRSFKLSTAGGKLITGIFGWLGYFLYWRDRLRRN